MYPPTGVCFNALKTLLEIQDRYCSFFRPKGLRSILSEVKSHFSRIQKYVEYSKKGAKLDRNLVNIIAKLLCHFLKICAIYHRISEDYKSIGGRAKNVLKATIGLDGTIKKQLEGTKKLADDEERLNLANIQGQFLITQRDNRLEQYRKMIKEDFKINEEEPFWRSWVDTEEMHREKRINGSGTWLSELAQFSTWAQTKQGKPAPLLALEAPEGHGKSFIASYAAGYLRKLHSRRDGSPGTLIASFYFGSARKAWASKYNGAEEAVTRGSTREDMFYMYTALVALILQLAEIDPSYQDFVANQLKKAPPPTYMTELWDKFIMEFGNENSSGQRKVFFLIIDGIERAMADDRTKLLKHIVQPTSKAHGGGFDVRVLVTSTPAAIQSVKQSHGQDMTVIPIKEHAQGDFRKYVENEIRQLIQKWQDDEQKHLLLLQLQEKFCKEVSGDFFGVNADLAEIRDTGDNDRLQRILDRQSNDRSNNIDWQLRRLQGTLSPEDIDEFNDVLICVTMMTVSPSVEQLAKFLWLQDEGRNPEGTEQRIRDRYGRLIGITDTGTVEAKEIKAYFGPSLGGAAASPWNISIQSAASDAMHRSEVTAVKRLTRSVYGEDLFDRFRLEHHFKHHQTVQRPIGLDTVGGHVKIVLCILNAVCSWKRADAVCFHEYAARSLCWHLKKISSDVLKEQDTDTKIQIGGYLYRFFIDRECVGTWLRKDSIDVIAENLYDCLNEAVRFFRNPAVANGACEVAKRIGLRQRTFELDHLFSMTEKVLASQWLLDDAWKAADALQWLMKIIEKVCI